MLRIVAVGVILVQAACLRPGSAGTTLESQGGGARFSRTTPSYWPTAGWRMSTPEEQGMSSAALADAIEYALDKHMAIHSLLIVRRGVLVLDASFYPFAPDSRHDLASVTKSVTSLLIGAAVYGQLLPGAHATLSSLWDVRPLRADDRWNQMTIGDLLSMRSGLDCGLRSGEAELHSMLQQADWMRAIMATPMRSKPGTEFGYCSGNYHLLSAVLTHRVGMPEADYARERLFRPLGISDVHWPTDPQGNSHGWGDLQLQPTDLAKIGFLMLHGGSWNGQQLVAKDWIEWSTTPRSKYGDDDLYGYGWWSHPASPPGFYEALGRGGQRLSVWPDKDIVVVMLGGGFRPGELAPFLQRALVADSALLPSFSENRRLSRLLLKAKASPPSVPIAFTECAKRVPQRDFTVDRNSLGLTSFRFEFTGSDATLLDARVGNQHLSLPIGFDGVYRFASTRVEDIAPAARGRWRADCTLVVELNLVGKIDNYTLEFAFEEGHARIRISERTGLINEEATATAVKR